jgi:hypothetical protein
VGIPVGIAPEGPHPGGRRRRHWLEAAHGPPAPLVPPGRRAAYVAGKVASRGSLGRICSVPEGRAWTQRGSGKGEVGVIGGRGSGKGHERTGRVNVPGAGRSFPAKMEPRPGEGNDEDLGTCRRSSASSAVQLPHEKGSKRAHGVGREIGGDRGCCDFLLTER